MIIKYIVLLLILLAFIGYFSYIHARRVGNKYMESYQWFVKILK